MTVEAKRELRATRSWEATNGNPDSSVSDRVRGGGVVAAPLMLITSTELCRRAGVSYRKIDTWTRDGLIVPHVDSSGSGTQRQWGEWQVGEVVELQEIINLGKREKAKFRQRTQARKAMQ